MKNQLIKLILFLWVILLFITFLHPSTTKAVSISLEEMLVCDGRDKLEEIYYQGNLLSISYIVTYLEGKTYPIYSKNQERIGASCELAYDVISKNVLKDEKIQTIIQLGYPNCSAEDLGCSKNMQAYAMTQIAIYDTYYHYDLTKFTLKENSYLTKEFISNMVQFIQKCRETNFKQEYAEITIDEDTIEWQEENENFCSKTYEIKTDQKIESYTVEILNNTENYILIMNEKNEEQNQFLEGEKFKIVIPKNVTNSFKIQVKGIFFIPAIIEGKPYQEDFRGYFFESDTQTVIANLSQEYCKKEENIDISENEDTTKEKGETEEAKYEQKTLYQSVKTQKKESIILPQTGM